jgi:gluconokinase
MHLHWEFEDGDWFHPAANKSKMHSGNPLTDDDRNPWLAAIAD